MATPVTLTIMMARIATAESAYQPAPAEVRTIINVDSWDVVGSFLTYKVGSTTTLIPHTRIVSITIQ